MGIDEIRLLRRKHIEEVRRAAFAERIRELKGRRRYR
jgi:hypothetical protein